MNTSRRYSPEVRERAVRMVLEHEEEYDSQWAAIRSIAEKFGCSSETLRKWVRRSERDSGRREGRRTSEERDRIKELERENRELKRANEILRKASAYFAQAELGRRRKCWCGSSTITGTSTGSSRSAGSFRSPRRRTLPTRCGKPTRTFARHERRETRS